MPSDAQPVKSSHPWIVTVRVTSASSPILSRYHFRATDIAGQWIASASTKEIAQEIIAAAKASGLHGRARNLTDAEAKMLLRAQPYSNPTGRPTVRRTRNKRRRGLGRRGM
jgi:hypothetical protein